MIDFSKFSITENDYYKIYKAPFSDIDFNIIAGEYNGYSSFPNVKYAPLDRYFELILNIEKPNNRYSSILKEYKNLSLNHGYFYVMPIDVIKLIYSKIEDIHGIEEDNRCIKCNLKDTWNIKQDNAWYCYKHCKY